MVFSNLSIAKLSLLRATSSPAISPATLSYGWRVSIAGCASKFFSANFLFSAAPHASFLFRICSFSNFLASPLCFSSLSNQAFSSTQTYTSSTSISFCTFTQCSSTNLGGAISCTTSGVNIIVFNCIFNGCNSTQSGGAIYSSGSNANSSHNCFFGCAAIYTTSSNWGSAFRFSCSASGFCEYCTIIYCAKPSASYSTWDGATIMTCPTQYYLQNNFTECQSCCAGAIQANSANSSTMAFINLCNLTGDEAIGFYSFGCSGSHSCFNLINGNYSFAAFAIFSSSYVISISNVYIYSYTGTLFTEEVEYFSTSAFTSVNNKMYLASIHNINTWVCGGSSGLFTSISVRELSPFAFAIAQLIFEQ